MGGESARRAIVSELRERYEPRAIDQRGSKGDLARRKHRRIYLVRDAELYMGESAKPDRYRSECWSRYNA